MAMALRDIPPGTPQAQLCVAPNLFITLLHCFLNSSLGLLFKTEFLGVDHRVLFGTQDNVPVKQKRRMRQNVITYTTMEQNILQKHAESQSTAII
eukprot:161560-Amphidinium_carterae.1